MKHNRWMNDRHRELESGLLITAKARHPAGAGEASSVLLLGCTFVVWCRIRSLETLTFRTFSSQGALGLMGLARFLQSNWCIRRGCKWQAISIPLPYLGYRAEQELLEAVEFLQESWEEAISYSRKEDAFTVFATFLSREAGWNHSLLRSNKGEVWRKDLWKVISSNIIKNASVETRVQHLWWIYFAEFAQ